MRDLLDPFESVSTPSPGAAGGAPPTITLRIKGTHPVRKIPAIVADVNDPNVSDQIEIWGLMVFAYLGELITNRINAANKSLFGAILGYPPLATVGDITMHSLWNNMIMATSRTRQPTSWFVAGTSASVTEYRGGVAAHPPILQANGGLLYNILIAVIQRNFSSEAAGITFSGGRSTRRKRRHGKKGRKTRRA